MAKVGESTSYGDLLAKVERVIITITFWRCAINPKLLPTCVWGLYATKNGNFARVVQATYYYSNKLILPVQMSHRQLASRLALFCISLLALSPALVFGHKIHIPASTKECFFEDLHEHDQVHITSLCVAFLNWPSQMTVTYQVGEGGHLDIDFWVRFSRIPSLACPSILLQLTDPEGSVLTKQIRQSTGSTSITAEKDGRYEYCFSNQMSTMADKEVRYAHHSRDWTTHLDAFLMHTIVSMFTVSYTSRKMVSLLFIPPSLLTIVTVVRGHRCTCRARNPLASNWAPSGQG